MASIASSPPFVIDRKGALALSTFRPRKIKSVAFLNGSTSTCGVSLFSNKGQFRSSKLGALRVASAASADNVGSDDNGSESDNALDATIEKTKKMLAMQRDLLQQISERREVVSSIQSSTMDQDEDEVVHVEGDNSLPNMLLSRSNFERMDEEQNDSILSSNHGNSNIKDETKIPPSDTVGDKSEHVIPEKASSDISPTEELKTTISEAFESDMLTSVSSYSYTAQENENLTEDGLEVVNCELDNAAIEYEKPLPLAGANVMNVILVAAECAPWSKTGGLGDVAGSLPKALARRGHRVMVVVPRYADYAEAKDTGIRKMYKVNGQDVEVTYFQAYIDSVDFVFIDSHVFRHIQNNIYGGERLDILKRMTLFCKAAVEVPWHIPCGGVCYGDGNLVFIANDWHTALLPVYLKAYYRDHSLMPYARSVLVIHNIAHQGRGPVDDFYRIDLPEEYMHLFKLYDPIGGEHLNIFAAGLKTADRVVTVSHGYAWELKTLEGGWGLHEIINWNDWKLSGIVNGIDSKEWNPQDDVYLKSDGYTNYSLETLQSGKAQCKAALQKELGLPIREDVPLIGFIGRLDDQKGVDLIAAAIPWMVDNDAQLVMLGTGRADLEQMLRDFENQYRNHVRGWVGFSVKTAHRITAGADILLMPSRFEPCGLNQLYAMSYGTLPVVHAVGGLRDTVQPFQPFENTGVGWTFDSADPSKLVDALHNCLLTFRTYKQSWLEIQTRAMTQDLSWDNAAQKYEEVLIAAKYQW